MLLLEPDPGELDRLSGVLRDAGFRVVALGKVDALMPLTRVFQPEVAVIRAGPADLETLRAGRRIHRRFRGVVPVLYLADAQDEGQRRACIESGYGFDVLPPGRDADLLARMRALLAFKSAITHREREAYEARSPSLHDDVTGLYNRRFLLELVAAETRRAERFGGSFSVMIAELDDFLRFRDRFGDEVCDRLMVHCSVVLRQALREADVLARVGRYHFAMLLPGSPAEVMGGLKERLGRRFALACFQVDGSALKPTMTFGSATFPDVVGPAQQVFARAIQDLDRARDEKRRLGPPRAAV